MAITYKKALKSIAVKTLGGTTVSVEDTVSAPIASNALAEFETFKTMHIVTGEGETTMIPFHAVDSIVVTVSASENITKADPYCEESGETGETETGETETGETETGETA